MVQITYRKKMVSITQIWFAENELSEKKMKTDICFFHEMPVKDQEKYSISTEFHTLISDLQQTEEELLSKINKNVRYEIRRNCKEAVEYKVFSPKELGNETEVVRAFAQMYELMYKEKGQKAVFNMTQFREYLKEEAIWVTAIYDKTQPLVFHSYIVGDKQVRLLHSVSDFRGGEKDANLTARANKRLHWEDICLFKREGKEVYDWGGISSLENPNGIDAFKCKFGGSPLSCYNVYKGESLLGKTIVSAMKLKNAKMTVYNGKSEK